MTKAGGKLMMSNIVSDKSSIKVKMVELTARVRVFGEQWLTTPGDLQEGAGGRRSTVL